MSRTLIVAGFHRSGTSLLTELLHRGGLHIGTDLLDAGPTNPYGHFEPRQIVRLHDRILAANGLSWQVDHDLVPSLAPAHWAEMTAYVRHQQARHSLWGFKDPRVCLFLSAWKHVVPAAKVVVMFRAVTDCAYSLERRQAGELIEQRGPVEQHRRFWTVPDLAVRMWLVHNRALLRFAREYPNDVVAVSFDGVSSGRPVNRLISERFGIGLRDVPSLEVFDPTVPTRRTQPLPLCDRSLADEIDATWSELLDLEERSAMGGIRAR